MIIGSRHIRGGTRLLIIQRPGINQLVLIIVAAGAGLTVGVALTLTCSDCHNIILRLSTLVTVMITAMVTRGLALPMPSGGGPVAVVGFDYLSYYLRRAAPGRCEARRTSSAPQR